MEERTLKRIEKILKKYETPNQIRPSPYDRTRQFKEGRRGIFTSE